LQSLDKANKYLCDFSATLDVFLPKLQKIKKSIMALGFVLVENEPLKITISSKTYGYSGIEIANYLAQKNIIAEFCDKDFITLMFTPQNSDLDLELLERALSELPKRSAIEEVAPKFSLPPQKLSVREAVFAKNKTVDVKSALGKICGVPTVGCPPAVPIIMCGEEITESVIECFEYYGIKKCSVIL
jgi:arginine/lysine/ornithine decarboxylase